MIYYLVFKSTPLVLRIGSRGGWLRVPAIQKAFFSMDCAVDPDEHINDVDARPVHPGQVVGARQPKALFIVPLGIGFNATYFRKRSLGQTEPASFGPQSSTKRSHDRFYLCRFYSRAVSVNKAGRCWLWKGCTTGISTIYQFDIYDEDGQLNPVGLHAFSLHPGGSTLVFAEFSKKTGC
ncbi:hypothetical protein ACCD10_10745 [Pseudomonas sp. Pseusp122]|uniref:hypothetical protein n=1 Tax=unclassified Pseudomonas TaxID=196821 RepID=UPI0039A43F29